MGSRTYVEQSGEVKWSEGDKLYVYGPNVTGVLTLSEGADTNEGKFSGFVFGNPDNLQWAVFGDDVKFTNDGAQFTIKEVTDPNSNSPMVGEIGSGSVQMEHLCGMVRLTINNLPQNAVVTLGGTGIAGTAEVKNGKITKIASEHSISLKTVDGTDNVFEIPVFATDTKSYLDLTLSINGVNYPFKAPVMVKAIYASEVADFNCVVENGVLTAISQSVETEEALSNALQAEGSVEIQLANDMEFDNGLTVGESTEASINLNGNALDVSAIKVEGKLTIEGAGKVLGEITLGTNGSLEILGGTYTQDIQQYVPSGHASISHVVNSETVYIAFEGEQSKVAGAAATTDELKNVLKNNVKDGKEIVVLAGDVTVTDAWDSRYTGGKLTGTVVMEGAGNTLKFANTVYDGGNYMSAFRFENPAVVKNLVFDLSSAKSGFASNVRAISAKSDLTVENCIFIGNPSLTNDRGIIFGEGQRSSTYTGIINISNCTFTDWRRGISDNENATDAKDVTIKNCIFNNSAAYLSAYSAIEFTGNMMDNSGLNIKTYSKSTTAKVIVMDNVLDSSKDNKILGFTEGNVECQEGVTVIYAE